MKVGCKRQFIWSLNLLGTGPGFNPAFVYNSRNSANYISGAVKIRRIRSAATDGVGAEVGSAYSRNLFLAAATIRSAAPSIPSVSVFTLKS
jgi:hypothetical protein